MLEITRASCDQEIDDAWRLFAALHDDPSGATARDLITWLEQGRQRVRVFDNVLTLWALAGGRLARHASVATSQGPLGIQ